MSVLLIIIHFFLFFYFFYVTSLWFIYIVIGRITSGLHDGGGGVVGPICRIAKTSILQRTRSAIAITTTHPKRSGANLIWTEEDQLGGAIYVDGFGVYVGGFGGSFHSFFMPFCFASFFPSSSHSRHVLFTKAFFFLFFILCHVSIIMTLVPTPFICHWSL